MKCGVNNIESEIFHETVLSILNAHTPLKKEVPYSKSCYFRN